MKFLLLCLSFAPLGVLCDQTESPNSRGETSSPPKLQRKLDLLRAKGRTKTGVFLLLGEPESVGRTAFGDIQWTYPNPNAPEDFEKRYRKLWIVFDEDYQVKEVHDVKVCWLTDSLPSSL
ncbi:hypothetical protein N8529_00045 [bacterium]|nr:hypothetical protein [bacterium]